MLRAELPNDSRAVSKKLEQSGGLTSGVRSDRSGTWLISVVRTRKRPWRSVPLSLRSKQPASSSSQRMAAVPGDDSEVSGASPHLPCGEAGIKNIEIWMDGSVRSNDAIALS